MMTPYEAAKIVNAELKKRGIKMIPPQMMYNYTTAKLNAGKRPLIKFDLENGVDADDLQRWLKNYISKKLASVDVQLDDQAKFDMSEPS